MKKIIFFLASLFLLQAALFSQKTLTDANAEKRNVSGYHGIEVSGGIDLYLSPGDEAVAVSASETKYRDKIITEVKDGILKIYYEHDNNRGVNINLDWGNRKLKAYVSFKTLDRLQGSGGSDITVDGTIKTSFLSMDLSGGSDFEGKIDAGTLNVDASGGSDVKISGIVQKLDIDASGGSDFKGYELVSEVCNIDASGGSDVYITVNKELSAESSGGSDVFYKGNGTVKSMHSSGSSSIKKVSR
ncbi:MAG TPA: head GIN domain-containing protein [Chitinophagaceae bacterium]|nr:head GIN domain-containing protein [Chitinophagaceae bacterium]